jgi:hypothetical protein
MSLQHAHNTRITQNKPRHGGHRQGAGRQHKENRNPNAASNLSAVNKQHTDEKKQKSDYKQQQNELVNHKGRTWSYHECTLILTLVIGIVLHYNETPTQALHTVSILLRRSYKSLYSLWCN